MYSTASHWEADRDDLRSGKPTGSEEIKLLIYSDIKLPHAADIQHMIRQQNRHFSLFAKMEK